MPDYLCNVLEKIKGGIVKYHIYRVGQKMSRFYMPTTLSNINRFSKLLLLLESEKKFVVTLSLKIPPHLKRVATLPYLLCYSSASRFTTWHSAFKAKTGFSKIFCLLVHFLLPVPSWHHWHSFSVFWKFCSLVLFIKKLWLWVAERLTIIFPDVSLTF